MSTTKIQLYSLATPNGQKISVALEEMGLEYEAHKVDIMNGDQFSEEFLKINPNSKIPAIVDPVGNSGKPFAIMESGAILIYLAEKSGRFLPKDPINKSEVLQWLFFQMGGVGPMFGQFGHFYKYAKDKCDHEYPVTRYTNEAKRLLSVLDKRLEGRDFIAAEEMSIADFALFPWVVCLDKFYNGQDVLELDKFHNVNRWVQSFLKRNAVQKGMEVCPF